jgi:hypothetical protein
MSTSTGNVIRIVSANVEEVLSAYLPRLLLPWAMHTLAPSATLVYVAVPGAPAGLLDDQALSRVVTRIRPDVVSYSSGTPEWPGAGQYRSGLRAAARAGVTVVAGTGLHQAGFPSRICSRIAVAVPGVVLMLLARSGLRSRFFTIPRECGHPAREES